MKIATFNINDVNKRLPNLLGLASASEPDVVCLQEIKSTDADFPIDAIRSAGYGAVWRGGMGLERRRDTGARRRSILIRDTCRAKQGRQSRYIEAAASGVVIASIYLPNGNPQPGPKFDYKMDWFDRLLNHAAGLLHDDVPVVLAGDYNDVPTDFDIYSVKSFVDNALLQPRRGRPMRSLTNGVDGCAPRTAFGPAAYIHSGATCAIDGRGMLGFDEITCCSVRRSPAAEGRGRRSRIRGQQTQATMRRRGSNWRRRSVDRSGRDPSGVSGHKFFWKSFLD